MRAQCRLRAPGLDRCRRRHGRRRILSDRRADTPAPSPRRQERCTRLATCTRASVRRSASPWWWVLCSRRQSFCCCALVFSSGVKCGCGNVKRRTAPWVVCDHERLTARFLTKPTPLQRRRSLAANLAGVIRCNQAVERYRLQRGRERRRCCRRHMVAVAAAIAAGAAFFCVHYSETS